VLLRGTELRENGRKGTAGNGRCCMARRMAKGGKAGVYVKLSMSHDRMPRVRSLQWNVAVSKASALAFNHPPDLTPCLGSLGIIHRLKTADTGAMTFICFELQCV
jgi:hypothetical protein